MAQSLLTFRSGALYLDAVILEAFLDARSPWHGACRDLFRQAIAPPQPIRLVTATLTIDETVFVLLQELLLRPPYQITRSRSQYLQDHPEIVMQLMTVVDPLVQDVERMISLEAVLPTDITAMRREMVATGTLPRDAIHLAVMRRLGITAIASDDDGFDRYPDITLFKP
jgi:predicted nucleic acid-binding protein